MGWVVFSAVEGRGGNVVTFPSSFRIHILEVMIDYDGCFFTVFHSCHWPYASRPFLLVFTNDPCVDQRWFQLGSGRTTVLTRLSM
jgi:hypothetical protein